MVKYDQQKSINTFYGTEIVMLKGVEGIVAYMHHIDQPAHHRTTIVVGDIEKTLVHI